MRFFVRFIASAVVAFVLTGYAVAIGNIHDLPELGMKVEIPDGYYVYTRESDIDDSEVTVFDTTMLKIRRRMEQNNVYLEAGNTDKTREISIIMARLEPEYDFRVLSKQELDAVCSDMGNYYDDKTGTLFTKSEYYYTDSAIFIKHYATMQKGSHSKRDIIGFFTVRNGKAITIRLISLESEIFEERELQIEEIIDSVTFYDENGKSQIRSSPEDRSLVFARFFLFIIAFIIMIDYAVQNNYIQWLLPKPLRKRYVEWYEKKYK